MGTTVLEKASQLAGEVISTTTLNSVPPPPPPFTLPPLYSFAYAPALLLFCILLQPSIPAHISTYGRRALIIPTLVFVAVGPYLWKPGPQGFNVGISFRLGIFGPDLVLKTLEWGLMNEKDRATKLAWVGFEEEKKQAELDESKDKEKEAKEVEKGVGKSTAFDSVSLAVPADKLKARLRNLSVHDSPSASPSSSGNNSPPSLTNLVLGQLPTPKTSPPSTPVDPITAAIPPRLHDTNDSALSKHEVRTGSAQEMANIQKRHPFRVVVDACHFLSAMRGMGYGWGPAPPRHRSHHRKQHIPKLPRDVFLRKQLQEFVWSQTTSVVCVAYQTLHRDNRIIPFLSRHLPFSLDRKTTYILEKIVNALAYITVGVSLYAQMIIGFSGAALGITLASMAVNSLLDRFSSDIKWRWSFDSREYAPLFDEPFGKMGEGGVASFWGHRWHALFKSPFTSLGFLPAMKLSKKFGLPKSFGRFLAVYLVFFLSAWMHVQAFASARWRAEPTLAGQLYASSIGIPLSSLTPAPWTSLSFRERYGTWIFFLLQPVAIALETLYLGGNKKRIGGISGRVWTACWVAGIGAWAVGRSWLALGLAHGVPPLEMWSWQRFVIPTAHLAPLPIWMKV